MLFPADLLTSAEKVIVVSSLTSATEVLAADHVRDVGDGVFREADVRIHLHCILGVGSPVKHEILCRVRVYHIHTSG